MRIIKQWFVLVIITISATFAREDSIGELIKEKFPEYRWLPQLCLRCLNKPQMMTKDKICSSKAASITTEACCPWCQVKSYSMLGYCASSCKTAPPTNGLVTRCNNCLKVGAGVVALWDTAPGCGILEDYKNQCCMNFCFSNPQLFEGMDFCCNPASMECKGKKGVCQRLYQTRAPKPPMSV